MTSPNWYQMLDDDGAMFYTLSGEPDANVWQEGGVWKMNTGGEEHELQASSPVEALIRAEQALGLPEDDVAVQVQEALSQAQNEGKIANLERHDLFDRGQDMCAEMTRADQSLDGGMGY
jgi:hypothetical protein